MLPFRKNKPRPTQSITIIRKPNLKYIEAVKINKLQNIQAKNLHNENININNNNNNIINNEILLNPSIDDSNSNNFMFEIINELALNLDSPITDYNEKLNIINYVFEKYNEKETNSYHPDINNKKLLFLIAAHTNTQMKLDNVKTLINLVSYSCIEIMVLNSATFSYSDELKEFCNKKNIFYQEKENEITCDSGKWVELIHQKNCSLYDFIFFANDSFKIEDSLNHFINLTISKNVELYAYNDSSEIKYHYQSYLFGIKSDAVYKYILMYYLYKDNITCFQDLIYNYELNMIEQFTSYECFLKIAEIPCNKGLNIFFHNDYLYEILKNTGLLPFVKLKRVT